MFFCNIKVKNPAQGTQAADVMTLTSHRLKSSHLPLLRSMDIILNINGITCFGLLGTPFMNSKNISTAVCNYLKMSSGHAQGMCNSPDFGEQGISEG